MSAPPHLSRSDEWLSRRAALKGLASIGLAAAVTSRTMRAQSIEPVAETTYGRVRGITRDGVNIFKGLPYAASTAGRNRFLPPQPIEPWAGVRDATKYGAAAPQVQAPGGPTTAWCDLQDHARERRRQPEQGGLRCDHRLHARTDWLSCRSFRAPCRSRCLGEGPAAVPLGVKSQVPSSKLQRTPNCQFPNFVALVWASAWQLDVGGALELGEDLELGT